MLLSRQLVDVQEKERRLLAYELHDQIGQELTGLQFTLEMGKRSVTGDLKKPFDEAQKQISSLMAQVRELSLNLRPAMLDDMGLFPTLQWHFSRYTQRTGIVIHFKHHGIEQRFPGAIETGAYRIIQEALTNIARYANINQAFIEVTANKEALTVIIKDEGQGFDPQIVLSENKTAGLTGMRERVYLLGGELTIHSSPGNGTLLNAFFPLKQYVERRKYGRKDTPGR